MSSRRLLLSFAHPDDESFGCGGLIAKYVQQGVDVYYICATNGDVGTVRPEFLEGYNSIAERRLAELECAAQKLGFKQVFLFGYKDSGMMGSQTSSDPTCLWQAPQEEVTRRVVEVIRAIQPQVVITFNKYGGYGHPDHIAIQRATTDAFNKAGDPDCLTDGQPPFQPQKLYYTSVPKLLIQIGVARSVLRRQDPRRLGVNKDIDLLAILENVEPAHTSIDIREYFDAWDEASACHASQLGGRSTRLPNWLRRTLAPAQTLTRVFPPPPANRIDEHDLFANVRLDTPQPSVIAAP
jgi:LmbE family N-acetylglucosaminyl deacetylase